MTNRTGKKSQRPFLYRSLASYLREVFGQTLRKVSLDPGFGCPNRDGTLGVDGCAFCNMESFVPGHVRADVDPVEQIRQAREGKGDEPFIAYLQAGTGTYTTAARFRELVDNICDQPGVTGLFIGTRPDCVDGEMLDVLLPWLYRKLVWLELGLQSANDATLDRMGRGHNVEGFTRARELASDRGIPVIAHVILGLPGEGPEEMMGTASYLARQRVEGVKIHHLQVIRGTRMEELFKAGKVVPLTMDSYPGLVAGFLERLPPFTVIQRLAADAMGDLLIAPQWPDRAKVIETIREYMLEEGKWQGRLYIKGRQDTETRCRGDTGNSLLGD